MARLQNAVTLCSASLRVAYATAFLEARAALDPASNLDDTCNSISHAGTLRSATLEYAALLPKLHLPLHPCIAQRRASVASQLRAVADGGPGDPAPTRFPEPLPLSTSALQPLASISHLCTGALCAGWEIAECVHMWARVDLGSFSASGRTFIPGPRTPQSPSRDWAAVEVRTIPSSPGKEPIHIFISTGQIVAITSGDSLRVKSKGPAGTSLPSLCSLPDFIALPRDQDGRPIIPKSRVTALVEAQHAWHHELGSIDPLTGTIVRGLLVMPKITTPVQQKTLRNHPSWEDDPAAQAALGPIIAKWLAQGVLEYVQWDDRRPLLLQPCGAVPKGSAPFYRLITDARFGNAMYSDWGVTYTSAAALSSALHPRDFTWSADLQDAYHLSVFAGCGGALRPCKRPIIAGDGSVSWIDGYIVGCSPDTCLGGCDKDMSGISISGHIFRFAACQFGQKTAGSPLNSIVISVAQYFARLPTPVHVATWVDDLHFSMRTPDHPPCLGHLAGCPVCAQAFRQATELEALWRRKALALNLPLSAGKGHTVAQGGPFTGVHLDTLRGTYTMLEDKLASLTATFTTLLSTAQSTPRLLARGRGKAQHYGCAIPLLASMCPALTQAIYQAETAFSLPPPATDDQPDFDWDAPLVISARTTAVLRLMAQTIATLGRTGQPIWPINPAAALHAFQNGTAPAGTTVVTAHCSPSRWGLTIRTRPNAHPRALHGPWTDATSLLAAPWIAQPAFSEAGAPIEAPHGLALAVVLGLSAAAPTLDLSARRVVVLVPCTRTTTALRHGSCKDPCLQDIVLLLSAARLHLRALDMAFLPCLPPSPAPPLSPEHLAKALQDSSTPALHGLAHRLAQAASLQLTIDLFASTTNTACPRFISSRPEAAAEACDAFLHPSWSSSLCPWCKTARPDFIFLFPPHDRVAEAIRRASQDQAHGIAVLPCATTSPWWLTAITASQTRVHRLQPYHRLRCSHTLLSHGTFGPGARLAVFHFDFWRGPEPRPRACPHGTTIRPPGPLHDLLAEDTLCMQHAWG